ncbi:MAG: DHA2 family efflux MFS transporter permease subunit [Rhizobiaceae bacterium]|nr:DHA2 family efflux MFS transporter permease subunit [Rhizobiaceae bacterium]
MSQATTVSPAGEVPHRGLISLSLMLATIMQVLDTTIANVALPSMTGDLGASQDTITWVLTSYIVAAAIMTPLTGWLSDRFGRRELFLVSVVGFTVSSMLCGMAWSLESMVAFRVMQGIFGASIAPLSQTFLIDITPLENRGSAMALWGAGIMVGPIIGPTLGGWLTETLDWRWVFFINLPVGIIAFIGCAANLPRIAQRLRGFDFFGFAMLSLGVGALQLMLDRGESVDWFSSTEIWLELGLAITGIWIFGVHLLTGREPFIDPRIFRDRNFVTGLVFMFVLGIILLSGLALMPPMLARLFNHPVITTGLVMAPRGVGTMISMILVGRLMKLVDPRLLVVGGLLLTAWSLHMMTGFSPQMDDWPIITSGIVQGLGFGLVFVPLSTLSFATLAPHFRTDGASLSNLIRNIGSSIGISVVTVMLTRNAQINHAELAAGLTPFSPALQAVSPAAAAGNPAALAQIDALVNQQALMISYVDDFKLMMLVTLCAIPLALLLRRPSTPAAGQPAPAAHMD